MVPAGVTVAVKQTRHVRPPQSHCHNATRWFASKPVARSSGSNVTAASRLSFPGNGPSGICLSYLLSGHTPYFSPDASHPNPLLHGKLGEQPHLSLLQQVRDAQSESFAPTCLCCCSGRGKKKSIISNKDGRCDTASPLLFLLQDLEYLCEGLEGRSSNPVAVLFDSLLLPGSDFGLEHTSPLEWRYEPEHAVPHLVLGKGPPGGAWHVRAWNSSIVHDHFSFFSSLLKR